MPDFRPCHLLLCMAAIGFAGGVPQRADAQQVNRWDAHAAAPPSQHATALVPPDSHPSFGQRLVLAFAVGGGIGAASGALASDPRVFGLAYLGGTIAGQALVNRAFENLTLEPAILGGLLGAAPLIGVMTMGNCGCGEEGFLVVAVVTIPLAQTIIYRLRR